MKRRIVFSLLAALGAALLAVSGAFAGGGTGGGGGSGTTSPVADPLPPRRPRRTSSCASRSGPAPCVRRHRPDGFWTEYPGSKNGPVLLSGFTPVTIGVDPIAQTVNVSVDGTAVGTWPARVTPSYLAFEGQGWADDLVVRTTA